MLEILDYMQVAVYNVNILGVAMRKFIMMSLIAALIAGCGGGGLIRPRVEKGIKNALPQYIGPAKEYTVRADGSTTDMLNGLIGQLHIEGTDVQIDPNLLLSNLWVDMIEVRYNTSREVTSVKETKLGATVSESVVNKYIELSRKGEDNLSVEFEPGKVLVKFVPNVAGVNIAVTVSGKPEIVGGNKVNFVADSGSVARVPMPAYLVNKILDRMNPILDMSVLKFPVSLSKITINAKSVLVEGSAEFKPVVGD